MEALYYSHIVYAGKYVKDEDWFGSTLTPSVHKALNRIKVNLSVPCPPSECC